MAEKQKNKKSRTFVKQLLIVVAVILTTVVFREIIVGDLADYLTNRYSYNRTYMIPLDVDAKIAEGLFIINNIKFRKNEEGHLIVRGLDHEKSLKLTELSHDYKKYSLIPKNKEQEAIAELKDNKIKFAILPSETDNNVFVVWEESASDVK